jgi:hypothetical protein
MIMVSKCKKFLLQVPLTHLKFKVTTIQHRYGHISKNLELKYLNNKQQERNICRHSNTIHPDKGRILNLKHYKETTITNVVCACFTGHSPYKWYMSFSRYCHYKCSLEFSETHSTYCQQKCPCGAHLIIKTSSGMQGLTFKKKNTELNHFDRNTDHNDNNVHQQNLNFLHFITLL